ncbi:hypothetical protein [Olleya sp. HaHaR_3_96]|uniref:hypothetical protein n=1 Tax=Olleya sp. HaHaR_3_96 TaxID=2745560 RepID=UPI001C4FB78C|nr:hypothetical protein [Olleya sp. HaHaR_3_96]QXP59228.1 hypothetical protein H0I26_15060 [Olleya sp. HaHaR_3_96]
MRKYYFTLFTFLVLLLSSCDADTIASCIIGIRPVLEEKELTDGQRNLPYSDYVNVEIENAMDSDYFIESVEVNEDLPNGIIYSFSNRTITFDGVSSVAGNFEFEVRVIVRPYIFEDDGSDNLCSNASSREYTIKIN